VNAKLTAPLRFRPGQEPVPAGGKGRGSGFCTYFRLFPVNSIFGVTARRKKGIETKDDFA
jgi:hypothetical protein